MAILQSSKVTSAAVNAMPGVGDGQSAKVMASTYSFTAAPATSDVIQSPLIQSGSVITDVTVVTSGLGTSGAIIAGYGLDPDYFITTTAAVTGGVTRMNAATALPLVLQENDTVDVTIGTAGANATGTVTIIVTFLPRNA